MQRGPIVLAVSLSLMSSFALPPSAALAGRQHGRTVVGGHVFGGGRPFVARPFGHHRVFPRPFVSHRFGHHHFFPRPFVTLGVIAAPAVVYAASPPVYYAPPAYYDPPASYAPPAAYSPPTTGTVPVAPPPTPTPSVVQYPHGRHELRGDGVTTPYTWVWIPNPPPPPPPAAPPVEPPASGGPPPARQSQIYHWTDEQGVGHWTDRWDAVPPRYRPQAKQPQPS